jgi:NAD(P)-dependent dehydrogenase (short-subunit alcohol dehydrogenase family)
MDEANVDSPVVFITGGAGGIGTATARRFIAAGWRAALVDKNRERVLEVAESLGRSAVAIECDVSQPQSCHAAVASTIAAFGRIDSVVAAAGLWTEGLIDSVTEDEFDRVMAVNVKGVFFTCQAAVSAVRLTRGSMTLIASDAGLQANKGAVVYCASKAAVVLLAKTLALDLAPDGVRVNSVCPGDVMSPMLQAQADTYGGADPAGYLASLLSKYPQGESARFIKTDEVAELLWFLAQPSSRPITGSALSIDFGLSAGVQ